MPITGTQHALMPAVSGLARSGATRSDWHPTGTRVPLYALSGVARSGATRSGYHSPRAFVVVGGASLGLVPRTTATAPGILVDSLTVTDLLDHAPNRCAFTGWRWRPTHGQSIIITLGSINNRNRLFAGRILNTEQSYLGDLPANEYTAVNAIDDTWGLDTKKVSERYTSTTYAAVVADLVTRYAPGYTVAVELGLGSLDEITFTNQDLSEALTQLAKRGGYYWLCDENDVVRLFRTDLSVTPPTIINAAHASLRDFHWIRDLSQVVTRVFVEGAGVNALAAVAPGETILAVEDTAHYEATGGTVVAGPQRITYTGKYAGGGGGLVGTGAAPSGAPVLTLASGAGLSDGTRNYAVTFVTPAGESIAGPAAAITSGLTPAPTTAPLAAAATIGSGPDPGSHTYAVTFVTSSGETTAGPTVTQSTDVTPNPVAFPIPGTPTSGLGPEDGQHDYAVTFVTGAGETTPSPISAAVTTAPLPAPASGPTGTPAFGTGPEPGSHDYAVTFVTAIGETTAGPSVTLATGETTAPASAPVSAATPTVGTGPDPGTHDYAVTFVTAAGETTAGPTLTKATTLTTPPASAPVSAAAPTVGTGPDPGSHDYAVTFVTSIGETTAGPTLTKATTLTSAPATAPVSAATPTIGTGPDVGTHDYAVTFVTAIGETTAGPSLTKATDVTPVPASALTPGTPTVGAGLDLGDHDYVVTFTTSVGQTTPGAISAAVTVTGANDPVLIGAPVFGGSGNLSGTYKYKYLFRRLSDGLTTAPSPASAPVTVAAASGVNLPLADCEAPPTGYERRWYRTTGAGSTYLSMGVSGGGSWVESGGNLIDIMADGSLGAAAPATTTVRMGHVALSAIPTGDANVTARTIYRRFNGAGTFKLVGTIANNVTTTFADAVPNASLGVVPPASNEATLNRIALTAIPIGSAEVTSRKIYRTVAGGSQLKLLTTIANNSTTTFADTVTDASLGANIPTTNTADLQRIALTAVPVGSAEVTSRNIYRTAAGGAQLKLVGTVAGNVTTTFSDTVTDASLGANVPTTNTAYLQRIALTAVPVGSGDVTSRKIYRTAAGGSQLKLVGTVAGNVTTTFNDTVTDASLGANVPIGNTATLNRIALTAIPLGLAGVVTSRKIYRTAIGSAQLKLVTTLANNTATTFTDTVLDASLGANVPTANTAAMNQVPLTGIPVGDANVTSRNLYRRSAGAGLKFLATIANNFTTTYLDTILNASLGAAAPTVTTATLNRIALSAIPIGSALVTARKIYRTVAGLSQLKLLATIANNTATTFSDTLADSTLGADVPLTNTATANQVALTSIPIGASAVTQRKVYRTIAGGAQLKLLTTLADNSTSTYTDSTADGSLGANVPIVDTSGLAQPQGNVIAGSTSLQIASIGTFPAAGWAVIGNGQQVIRYTGVSGNVLTGIPASGPGSIQATIAYNSTVTASPQLIGIPASGTGAIRYPILKGDPVNLWVQVDDLTAQATLAALMGTDGIIEDYLQDRRLSHTEATARGRAQLALRSLVEVSVTYRCRDLHTRAGRTVPVNLPTQGVVGTFKIQQVTINNFGVPHLMPTFTASASTSRFSFEDLLRVARKGGTS